MSLISIEELSQELSVPADFLADLVTREVIIPYGGRARLGEPRFSRASVPVLRTKVAGLYAVSEHAATR
mgnify:CR=1 FL=1